MYESERNVRFLFTYDTLKDLKMKLYQNYKRTCLLTLTLAPNTDFFFNRPATVTFIAKERN
jgi:hypothetical protein